MKFEDLTPAFPAFVSAPRGALVMALTILCGAMNAVFGQATAPPAEPQKNVVEALPEKPPTWLDGYQLRYTLRLMGLSPAQSTSKSIVSRMPTGGWLKPDGTDIAVVCADGTSLPVAVLSHTPQGDTLIQFPRHGADVWYWVHAGYPSAPPAAKTWAYVPRDMFLHPDYAHVAALEVAGPNTGASFGFGIDDSLVTSGSISPFSIRYVIRELAAGDVQQIPVERQDRILDLLMSSEAPERWPLLEKLAKHRIAAPGLDP